MPKDGHVIKVHGVRSNPTMIMGFMVRGGEDDKTLRRHVN